MTRCSNNNFLNKGKWLVGDVTCVNTLTKSHTKSAVSQAGAPSEAAEVKKHKKYENSTSSSQP